MNITPVEFERSRFWVTSATQAGVVHLVDLDYEGAPACSCEDFMCRNRQCKHIRAVLEQIPPAVTVS
jgi:hypothetical protein